MLVPRHAGLSLAASENTQTARAPPLLEEKEQRPDWRKVSDFDAFAILEEADEELTV